MYSAGHTSMAKRRPVSVDRLESARQNGIFSSSLQAVAINSDDSAPRLRQNHTNDESTLRLLRQNAGQCRFAGEKPDSSGFRQSDSTGFRSTHSNRLRGHRSLDVSELYEYDPLLQQYRTIDSSNTLPPADPPAPTDCIGGGSELHASFSLPPNDNFASLSQGNLMHFDGMPGDSSAISGHYSGHQRIPVSISGGISFPLLGTGMTAGAGGGVHFYQPQPSQRQHPFQQQIANGLSARSDMYSMQLAGLQREYELLRREYETTAAKLNSNLNSIKTFWSPELKKERSMRKEEAAKVVLIHEQLRAVSQEAQRQKEVVRQLQTELQCQYELSKTIRDTELQSVSKEQYEAIRLEKERLHRELTLSKETTRDLEMQIASQRKILTGKDESMKKLLDMMQSKGSLTYSAAQDRLELEQCRARQIDLENRCRRYETFLQQKEHDVRSLREECLSASEKLRRIQTQCCDPSDVHQSRLGSSSLLTSADQSAFHSLLDNREHVAQLEQRIMEYENEIRHLRELKGFTPRERSLERNVTSREYEEMKTKVEKLEIDLAQKKIELQASVTKCNACEEQITELKRHVELAKNTVTTKEEQISMLDADMKALQAKLESRNDTIEQKIQDLRQAQMEKTRHQTELADLNDQIKLRDSMVTNLQRKIESLEETIKEREIQLSLLRQRLEAPQSSAKEDPQLQAKMEQLTRERDQLSERVRKQNDTIGQDRMEELNELHRVEVRDLRMAIDTLQKDITDRQVLIESQQEKISDLTREVAALRSATQQGRNLDGDFYANEFERLHRELQEAREEIENLLKVISRLEKEKEELNDHIRTLEKQIEESQTQYSTTFERKIGSSTADTHSGAKSLLDQVRLRQKEQRMEELEEALKESVHITAEHQAAIAHQKHTSQHMESKMHKYKEQLANVQRQYDEMKSKLASLSQDKVEKESAIRSLKRERKQHLEEALQLKEEALLAAISEKDAQIALLETSQTKNPEEIESLRRHKDKLIKKLKEENARRVKLMAELKESSTNYPPAPVSTSAQPPIGTDIDSKTSPVDQDQVVQAIRFVELQKKKLRVFIDQLVACLLDIDPDLLTGLPRTQQSSAVDIKLLKKMTHEQLLLELQQRDTDSLQLQRYATQLMQRLAQVQPALVSRAMKLLDSFNGHPSTSEAFFYVRLSGHYQKTKRQGASGLSSAPSTLPTASSGKNKGQQRAQIVSGRSTSGTRILRYREV